MYIFSASSDDWMNITQKGRLKRTSKTSLTQAYQKYPFVQGCPTYFANSSATMGGNQDCTENRFYLCQAGVLAPQSTTVCLFKSGLGIRSLFFPANCASFDKKEQIALLLFLKEQITLFKTANRSFCSCCKEWRERIVTIFKWAKERIPNPA